VPLQPRQVFTIDLGLTDRDKLTIPDRQF
jgi:hypothetical protein